MADTVHTSQSPGMGGFRGLGKDPFLRPITLRPGLLGSNEPLRRSGTNMLSKGQDTVLTLART
jgi:hypothetical protein